MMIPYISSYKHHIEMTWKAMLYDHLYSTAFFP